MTALQRATASLAVPKSVMKTMVGRADGAELGEVGAAPAELLEAGFGAHAARQRAQARAPEIIARRVARDGKVLLENRESMDAP